MDEEPANDKQTPSEPRPGNRSKNLTDLRLFR